MSYYFGENKIYFDLSENKDYFDKSENKEMVLSTIINNKVHNTNNQ